MEKGQQVVDYKGEGGSLVAEQNGRESVTNKNLKVGQRSVEK